MILAYSTGINNINQIRLDLNNVKKKLDFSVNYFRNSRITQKVKKITNLDLYRFRIKEKIGGIGSSNLPGKRKKTKKKSRNICHYF